MDNLSVWALGGVGLAAAAVYSTNGSSGVTLSATPDEALSRLDRRSKEVFGTGLGGLHVSSHKKDDRTAAVNIRRIRTGQTINCWITIEPIDELTSNLSTDCVGPMAGNDDEPARTAALSIIEPVAREYAVSMIEARDYEASGVVDEMVTGIHSKKGKPILDQMH